MPKKFLGWIDTWLQSPFMTSEIRDSAGTQRMLAILIKTCIAIPVICVISIGLLQLLGFK